MRRFLISRETLSVRMLDDNLDPTPLLKEIRDDKVATIIIDANASVSYLILKKVSSHTSAVHAAEPPARAHVRDSSCRRRSTLGFTRLAFTCTFGKSGL